MKYIFNNNGQDIININDVIRDDILKNYDKALLFEKNRDDVITKIRDIFIRMYAENKNSYNLYIQVMLADTYKMLYYYQSQNMLTVTKQMSLNILNNFNLNPEEMYKYIKTSSGIFEEMIESTIIFSELNLLGKKTIVQNSVHNKEQILKISPLYGLDILEYGEKTTSDDFLKYHKDNKELIVSDTDVVINNIISHMKHLYIFNKENYLENIQNMCNVFYKWRRYVGILGDRDTLIDLFINEIENKSLEILGNDFLYNKEFASQIVNDFCYYSTIKGARVNNRYIEEEDVNKFILGKLPSSLQENVKSKIKK